MRKNQILLSGDDDIATEIATILSIDEETKRASVQFEDETILPSIEFFYHCMPDDVEEGYQAFTVSDKIIVAERKYIIGFEDLKPRPCEVHILGGTSGSKGKILKSLDMGETWADLGQPVLSEITIRGIVGLGSSVALAGTQAHGKIIRSIDNGENWADLGQQYGESWVIDIIHLGGGVCLAGTSPNAKILKSIDSGLTWADLGQQFGQSAVTELSYVGNGVCLATTQGTGGDPIRDIAKIIRSTNYGNSWSVVWNSPEHHYQLESIAYLEYGICIAGAGFNGWCLRSIDYGLTWITLDIPGTGYGYWEAPTYVGAGICLFGFHQQYGSYEGHIFRSVNYGATWTDLGQMFGESWIYELAYVGAGICLAGTGSGGKILRSTNKGLNWADLEQQGGQAGITSLKRLNVGF